MQNITQAGQGLQEFRELRQNIRNKADQMTVGEPAESEQVEENMDIQHAVSKEWSSFLDGPVSAKWVPTENHNCTLILFDIPAGTAIDFHNHRPSESFVVIGDVTLYTPSQRVRLQDGDVMKVESRNPHAIVCHNDTLLNLLWVPAFRPDPRAPKERVLYEARGVTVNPNADDRPTGTEEEQD